LKKSILGTILVHLSLIWTSSGLSQEVLIRMDAVEKDRPRLEHLPLALHYRSEDYLLATMDRRRLAELGASGLSFEVLDETPWSEPYYVVSWREGAAAKESRRVGRLLMEHAGEAVLKISDDQAVRVAETGPLLYRVPRVAIPWSTPRVKPDPEFTAGPWDDPRIRHLVNQVADSTLEGYIRRLQEFRTRYSFSDSIQAAGEWLRHQFLSFGFTEVAFDSFSFNGTWQRNVVATKWGRLNRERVIILGGHYDSVVYDGTNPRLYAPGADDNGSGTAGVLEVARILSKVDLDATVKFIPFAAEEQGLIGSTHFAENAAAGGMEIALVINLDMIANVADNFPNVRIYTDPPSRGYAEMMAALARTYTNLIPEIPGNSSGSDHFAFQQFGYPALFGHEGDFSPNWHRFTDTLDRLTIPYANQVVRMALATAVTVASAPAAPTGLAVLDPGDGMTQILRWNANPEADIAGYKVFTGHASGHYDNVRLVRQPSDTLRGLQDNVPIYVAVAAFDVDGYVSTLSPEVVAIPNRVPRAPRELDITSRPTTIDLQWAANDELDVVGYRVYRSQGADTAFTLAAFVPAPGTSWHDSTAMPRVFYRYGVRAVDATALESAASRLVRGRLATHDGGILIVDGTRDGNGAVLRPKDEQVDQFYESLLQGFGVAAQWDIPDSLARGVSLTDADLGIYSTLVWHDDVRIGIPLVTDTLALRKYLHNGGKLWLSGWTVARLLNPTVSDTLHFFPQGSLAHDYLKIAAARTTLARDLSGASTAQEGYPNLSVDPVKVSVLNHQLAEGEVLSSLVGAPTTEVVYRYASSQGTASVNHGQPVALRYLGDDFKIVVFDFPLFFMDSVSARLAAEQVMKDLGERPVPVAERPDQPAEPPRSFALHQNFPNPFNPETHIRYDLPVGLEPTPTTLIIYNLLGQKVRTLVDEKQGPGRYAVTWDGRDENGNLTPTGVYIYQLRSRDFVQSRKTILLR